MFVSKRLKVIILAVCGLIGIVWFTTSASPEGLKRSDEAADLFNEARTKVRSAFTDKKAKVGDSIAVAGNYDHIIYDQNGETFDGQPAPLLMESEILRELKGLRKTDYPKGYKHDPTNPLQGTILDNSEHRNPNRARLPGGYVGKMTHEYSPYEQYRVVRSNYGNREKVPRATFFTIVRNSEVDEILGSIQQLESRFNHRFHYDWVFVNDEPFTDEFILATSTYCSGTVRYGIIPHEHWSYPDYVDQQRAKEYRESEEAKSIIYGDSESYRFMCRYNSRYFYWHPIMDDYEWYWRVEPSVTFQCDILEDPFRYMVETGKLYGFTVPFLEFPTTVKTLWRTTKDWWATDKQAQKVKPPHDQSLMHFVSDDDGEHYNYCHFWTNFEISRVDLFRSDLYESYVDFIDRSGGFFYERWGDAPVHSIFVSTMLKKEMIHNFQEISYQHSLATTCPCDDVLYRRARCTCTQDQGYLISSLEWCPRLYLTVSGEPLMHDFNKHLKSSGRLAMYEDNSQQRTAEKNMAAQLNKQMDADWELDQSLKKELAERKAKGLVDSEPEKPKKGEQVKVENVEAPADDVSGNVEQAEAKAEKAQAEKAQPAKAKAGPEEDSQPVQVGADNLVQERNVRDDWLLEKERLEDEVDGAAAAAE